MPFARLTLTPPLASDRAAILSSELTDLIARDLGKQHDLTSVLIDTSSILQWTIGGDQRSVAAHLEVCVTAGTNDDAEKRSFIAHAMAMMRAILPDLHAATYVVIKEVAATDWGYDGRTQADRKRAAA